MRPSHKLSIMEAVSTELERRYSYEDIDTYLNQFKIDTPTRHFGFESSRFYAKSYLRNLEAGVLIAMAADLEVSTSAQLAAATPPLNWPEDNKFRLFISHLTTDKAKATRLRDCLEPFHISGFVAHQDITPTAKWQPEIERALGVMDAFVAIHTKGFSSSTWTQQEIGFAVARGVKSISLKMDEDPTGFISPLQALPRLGRKAEEIAAEIAAILGKDELTKDRMKRVRDLAKPKPDPEEIPF